jgi:hypothetical protein
VGKIEKSRASSEGAKEKSWAIKTSLSFPRSDDSLLNNHALLFHVVSPNKLLAPPLLPSRTLQNSAVCEVYRLRRAADRVPHFWPGLPEVGFWRASKFRIWENGAFF